MKKITLILLIAAVSASLGSAIAYYNTASLGYDSANLISFYDGGVNVLEFDINYKKVQKDLKHIFSAFPEKFISI